MRPIAIVALQESDENVRFIMDSVLILKHPLSKTGLDLTKSKSQVVIIRSQYDTKMAKLLNRSDGAHCQLCTATFVQAHHIDLARDGFPINRFISMMLRYFLKKLVGNSLEHYPVTRDSI